jgi:hypothetical protein
MRWCSVARTCWPQRGLSARLAAGRLHPGSSELSVSITGKSLRGWASTAGLTGLSWIPRPSVGEDECSMFSCWPMCVVLQPRTLRHGVRWRSIFCSSAGLAK